MSNELILRQQATRKTLAKFSNRPFKYGSVDCVKMARFHAMQLGHTLPRPPRYTTAVGALRAIKNLGHNDLDAMLGAFFPRIAPAAARIGDLVTGEGEGGIDAVFIKAGQKLAGFHVDSDELVMITPERIKSAFRL